jgi:glycerol transport system ATP-binding protein
VGHFIGSPGMKFLPVRAGDGALHLGETQLAQPAGRTLPEGELVLGIRPEYVRPTEAQAPGSVCSEVAQVQDVGTYLMLTARLGERTLKARLAPETQLPAPGEPVWLQVLGTHTCFYRNQELVA